MPIFKQALLRRGIPQRLYLDNGANYRSQHLALVCAKLGVALIHARPYQPQGKGKMERWFGTVRSQLLSRLTDADTESLETLNRRLWAWVEGDYHRAPHRGLEEHTPLDRWAMSADSVRLADRNLDLDALFLFEAKRRVQRDRTVSLNGALFEADAALVGQTVTLRFDPGVPASRGIEIWHAQRFVALPCRWMRTPIASCSAIARGKRSAVLPQHPRTQLHRLCNHHPRGPAWRYAIWPSLRPSRRFRMRSMNRHRPTTMTNQDCPSCTSPISASRSIRLIAHRCPMSCSPPAPPAKPRSALSI
ncbi:MAG: integrase core domain-containing protein [Burkholderiales bacterium]